MASRSKLNCPVLFLVYNRLETTKKVFNVIKKVKPARLYISSDGPKLEKVNESKIINDIREFILSNIDWDCKVYKLFQKNNLGCKHAVSNGINWFFENENFGIILEDDCLPNQSFFFFCEAMLEKYALDKRINMITGTSYLPEDININVDYFFSKYFPIWGWATWKDRWNKYDINMYV